MSRRGMFGALGLGAAAVIAGCDAFSGAPKTITITQEPTRTGTSRTGTVDSTETGPNIAPTTGPEANSPIPTTVLVGLIFTVRLHIANLTAAIAADERDAGLFREMLADRQAHAKALADEYQRLNGQPAPQPDTTATTTSGSTPADPDGVIGQIRQDAMSAQSKFSDLVPTSSRYQAQLFASIAACLATHRLVLS